MAKVSGLRGLKVRPWRRSRPGDRLTLNDAPALTSPSAPRSQNYIQEIRSCTTKEQEKERVDKELGKIRKKYTSDKAMTGARRSTSADGPGRWRVGGSS